LLSGRAEPGDARITTMRHLLGWLDAAIAAQPFYTDEIAAQRMAAHALRLAWPRIDHRPPG
jgi:hypothetical protein